jgi:hypothetical protein
MTVQFKKDSDGNFVLHCIRKDGSQTWQKYTYGMFQVEHDMMHFVLESTLGYSQAFYGLLASGKDIAWFAKPIEGGTKKPTLPPEAYYAEVLVGALQRLRNDDEFFEMLASTCENLGIPVPAITPNQVRSIQTRVTDLVSQWQSSRDGITLEFL